MADHLHKQFGGKVYLVKNVRASQQTLKAMYGSHIGTFIDLKRELDPACVLCNKFLKNTFGDLLPAECGPSPAGAGQA
jgi:decaprenylphospho-beta-D-ribofuranose 2-oxidase